MKKILLLLIFFTNLSFAQIKVACVGNSITYGAGIVDRERNSYPQQLLYLLGDGYIVENFGHNSRTLLKKGDRPYVNDQPYANSIEFCPDIVIIKLGTNDLKLQNLPYLESDFYSDYKELVESYRSVNKDVRVLICTPVRCYLPDSIFSTKALENIVIPNLKRLAKDLDCEIVNLYSVFDTVWHEHLMPDKLHPSSIGAGILAQHIYEVIKNEGSKSVFNEGTEFNFHGYVGRDFKMNGVDCKFVSPKRVAKGAPWVLRARFWGHEPQLDIALLERGFAIAYCDVADLYGSQKAVKRWNDFYDYMVERGMSKKVVLEGMSRGGLIVYNWAAQNANKVAAIYADAPVMDFMSWPVACEWKEDVEKMLNAYGFKNIEQAKKWRGQPIDHAKKLVGIPILHVVGDADDVVSVKDNTAIFEERFKAAGGEMIVIHKPYVGHHPHSLVVPKPLVDFVLKSCKMKENLCAKPTPGNEYRALAAGWVKGSTWHTVANEISDLLQKPTDILLLGNSITQGFVGERKLVAGGAGKRIADSLFAGKTYVAAAISGDRIQHLIWRVQNGNYENANPKNIFITIGINNLYAGDDPKDVAEGILELSKLCVKKFPNTNITLFGVLPAGLEKENGLRIKCDKVHEIIKKAQIKNVRYVNPYNWFVGKDGKLITELYSPDNLHLSEKGYLIWCKNIAKLIN